MTMHTELYQLAHETGEYLHQAKHILATAESCTGGWIAEIITDVPGSSAWFDCGFVTYSNQAKQRMLEVNRETLESYGAVSAETALAMVDGVLAHSQATLAVAVTGIAGPGGGSEEKPVGTVFIAWKKREGLAYVVRKQFSGDRRQIRAQTVKTALEGLRSDILST